jgi:hypothetical protein
VYGHWDPVLSINMEGGIDVPGNGVKVTRPLGKKFDGSVVATWCTPYNNLVNLPLFNCIDSRPDGDRVELILQSNGKSPSGNMQIRVHVFYTPSMK